MRQCKEETLYEPGLRRNAYYTTIYNGQGPIEVSLYMRPFKTTWLRQYWPGWLKIWSPIEAWWWWRLRRRLRRRNKLINKLENRLEKLGLDDDTSGLVGYLVRTERDQAKPSGGQFNSCNSCQMLSMLTKLIMKRKDCNEEKEGPVWSINQQNKRNFL